MAMLMSTFLSMTLNSLYYVNFNEGSCIDHY
jgi:hypothetical protein